MSTHAPLRTPPRPGPPVARRVAVAAAVLGLVAAMVAGTALVTSGSDVGRRVDGLVGSVTSQPTGPPDRADGRLGDGDVSVHDDAHPAISGLDPALLSALRAAADEATAEGLEVRVTSGWRSRAYQQHLLDQEVLERGSYEEARRWVSTPDESAHVTGDAVDIGPTDAAYWFAEHGSDHGLCQVYANEIWHYELLVAPGGECPPMRADSSS